MNNSNLSPSALNVRDLAVCINDTAIVHGVNFALEPGEIGCLLGPSGCGKTTILRTIAGFEQPSGGEITLGDRSIASEQGSLPTEKRGVGMVFQDLALFPHLRVEDNIGFGIKHWPRAKRRARVEQLLALIDLRDAGRRYPHELSGGQQQRVALARAVAPKPALLLLDEPFSGQDAERREALAREVRALLKQEGITGLIVTHDQLEAFAIADRVGVIQAGEIHQWDSAYKIYHEPADRFVASFVGEGVLVCGSVMGSNALMTELGEIQGDLSTDLPVGTEVDLLVRPDDVVHDDSSNYGGVVISRKFRGSEHLYTIRLPGSTRVLCAAPSHHDHQVGERIGVCLKLDHLVIFDREHTPDRVVHSVETPAPPSTALNSPLPRSGGTYALVLEATHSTSATVGALGTLAVEPGYYLYVGSAHGGGGLQARVGRHLALDKPLRWHMDYLRPHLQARAVWWQADARRLETSWVEQVPNLGMTAAFKGFGASDSRHDSHLFYSRCAPSFERWQRQNPSCHCWQLAHH